MTNRKATRAEKIVNPGVYALFYGATPVHASDPRDRFLSCIRHIAGLKHEPHLSVDEVMGVYDYTRDDQALCDKRHAAAKIVGGQLANIAFNWAQKPGYVLTSDDVVMLDKLRRQWDEALKT